MIEDNPFSEYIELTNFLWIGKIFLIIKILYKFNPNRHIIVYLNN